MKFESGSIETIAEEYSRVGDPKHTALHLDHIPVIDEDLKHVDYVSDISRAIVAGFFSVMVDGSRLDLRKNIEAVGRIVEIAHSHDIPVEAELGAVMGHERGGHPGLRRAVYLR